MEKYCLIFLTALLIGAAPISGNATTIFINELHYDNDGGDVDEGVEIAAPAGTDLSDWLLYLYNGSNGALYDELVLSGTVPDLSTGFGALFFPLSGIQNGPDGIALVDAAGQIVQFLSYEGSFVAVDGPAAGLASTDIGVAEIASLAGTSLQLAGAGRSYADFTWVGPQAASFGDINEGQSFVALPLPGGLPFLSAALALLARIGSSRARSAFT